MLIPIAITNVYRHKCHSICLEPLVHLLRFNIAYLGKSVLAPACVQDWHFDRLRGCRLLFLQALSPGGLSLYFSFAFGPVRPYHLKWALCFLPLKFLCFISFIYLGPKKHISCAPYHQGLCLCKLKLEEVIFSSLLHQLACLDKTANDRILSKSQINRDIQTKVCEYKNTKDYNNVSHCTVLNVFEISERLSP